MPACAHLLYSLKLVVLPVLDAVLRCAATASMAHASHEPLLDMMVYE